MRRALGPLSFGASFFRCFLLADGVQIGLGNRKQFAHVFLELLEGP